MQFWENVVLAICGKVWGMKIIECIWKQYQKRKYVTVNFLHIIPVTILHKMPQFGIIYFLILTLATDITAVVPTEHVANFKLQTIICYQTTRKGSALNFSRRKTMAFFTKCFSETFNNLNPTIRQHINSIQKHGNNNDFTCIY